MVATTVVELNGSGTGGGSATGCTARRTYWVRPYRQAFTWAVQQLEQFDPKTQQPAGGRLFLPGTRLYAKRFDVTPLGKPSVGSDGNIDYDRGARVTLDYETRQFNGGGFDSGSGLGGGQTGQQAAVGDPANIPYMQERVSFAPQVVVVRKKDELGAPVWEWKSDGKAVPPDADDVQLFKLVCKAEWTLTKLYVPPKQYNRKAIMDAGGKINDATLCGLAAKTVMFNGADVSRQFQVGAATYYEIQYSFTYFSKGWNNFFRGGTKGPNGDGWDEVRSIDGDAPMYESVSMRTLIPELGS